MTQFISRNKPETIEKKTVFTYELIEDEACLCEPNADPYDLEIVELLYTTSGIDIFLGIHESGDKCIYLGKKGNEFPF
jgi:hypothetical protein